MKFQKIIDFRAKAEGIEVRFIPVEGKLPGFSHRVLIYQHEKLIGKDWLGEEFNPNQKNAEYYIQKHIIAPNPEEK